MRIAMTMEQLWHRVPGGTGVAALGMARSLDRRGDVDVVGVAARHRHHTTAEWTSPVPVSQLPLPRIALYESWHRLRRPRVQRATGTVDLIHATSIAIPPRSAPLVVTIHDLAFRDHPEMFTARGRSFFDRGLALALTEADMVLCPSRSTKQGCLRAGFTESRLRVVPLGIDRHPADERSISRVRSRYDLRRDYLIWSGTIEPRKNLRRLIRAYGSLEADVDLVLVGPRGWNEDLERLVAGDRRPRVLGFVPAGDLAALYAGARALVWPSLKEGFGFPVLEAMAQSTPVITSLGTSTEEIAGDSGWLVDPLDTDAIADAMREVLTDEGKAEALGRAGFERAGRFSWDRTAGLIIDAYGEVI